MALTMFQAPIRSISTTARNAFVESCMNGARKFPAAPALQNLGLVLETLTYEFSPVRYEHHEVNTTQLFNATASSSLQRRQVSNIGCACEHLRAGSD